MGGRGAELARMIESIQRQRNFQLAMWRRDYAAVAERLRVAYEDAIDVMIGSLGEFSEAAAITDEAAWALIEDIEGEWKILADRMKPEADQMQLLGGESGYRFGLTSLQAGGVRSAFNQTQLEAIQAVIDFTSRAAFIDRVDSFAPFYAEKINGLIQTAVAKGINPRDTAAIIEAYLKGEGVMPGPLADLERMTRTVQIYSSRTATDLIYQENGIGEWIWWAALDGNTCLGCISLHGTRHPVGEMLNDHHRGRCSPVPVTPRWEELGFSGGGEPNFLTGPEWFERQEETLQRGIMNSNQLYDDWKAGNVAITPDNVVTVYDNDVYGPMRRRGTDEEIRARSGGGG